MHIISFGEDKCLIPLIIEQRDWAVPFLAGWACLAPIIWLIIGILLCVWVYRDAESRKMNGALWLIIVLISGIIGLIIYLIVRKEKPPPPPTSRPEYTMAQPSAIKFCPYCGKEIEANAVFCPYCGKKVS